MRNSRSSSSTFPKRRARGTPKCYYVYYVYYVNEWTAINGIFSISLQESKMRKLGDCSLTLPESMTGVTPSGLKWMAIEWIFSTMLPLSERRKSCLCFLTSLESRVGVRMINCVWVKKMIVFITLQGTPVRLRSRIFFWRFLKRRHRLAANGFTLALSQLDHSNEKGHEVISNFLGQF